MYHNDTPIYYLLRLSGYLGRVLLGRYRSFKGFVSVINGEVAFLSWHFTPNEGIREFQGNLDRLEDTLRELKNQLQGGRVGYVLHGLNGKTCA